MPEASGLFAVVYWVPLKEILLDTYVWGFGRPMYRVLRDFSLEDEVMLRSIVFFWRRLGTGTWLGFTPCCAKLVGLRLFRIDREPRVTLGIPLIDALDSLFGKKMIFSL